jgi:hypothetical protein
MKKKATCFVIGGIALFLFCSPFFARMGGWTEIRRWRAPNPNPFGHDRPLYLAVEQTHSVFDILKLYPSERLLVTDGGYAYIIYFEAPAHPAKSWVEDCDVTWSSNRVTFSSPTGLTIQIDRNAVLRQL